MAHTPETKTEWQAMNWAFKGRSKIKALLTTDRERQRPYQKSTVTLTEHPHLLVSLMHSTWSASPNHTGKGSAGEDVRKMGLDP